MKFKVLIGVAIITVFTAGIFKKKEAAVFQENQQATALYNNVETRPINHLDTEDIKNQQAITEWSLMLVNATHKIPNGYTVELQKLPDNQAVDKRIYPELQEMFQSAKVQGLFLKISSSYRTTAEQKAIMADKIWTFQKQGFSRNAAKKEAEKWVAAPKTSEHELGLAVDINAKPNKSLDLDVYNWLAENAYKYGFILRYPSEKTEIPGVDYEPWHYRYVGKSAAKEIYESGLTLEEYLQ